MRLLRLFISVILVIFFSGCGSGDDASFDAAPKNVPALAGFAGSVDENATLGKVVGNITITIADDSQITVIDLNGTGAADFSVSAAGEITVAAGLDYETVAAYSLSARAQNAAGWSGYVPVNINVGNIAETPPTLSGAVLAVDENATDGTTIGTITIVSAGDSPITAIDLNGTGSANFSVLANGLVTVAAGASLDYETLTAYSLSARAQNGAGWSDYVALDINVTDIAEVSQVQMPLLLIAISFNDFAIADTAFNWNNKIFGMSDAQVNHYFNEVSYGRFTLLEANETEGTVDDGIINVSLGINHPGNLGMDRNHLVTAVSLADPFIDFSAYDTDGNNAISTDELQIMFIVAGGETAYGDPVASSVWAHAWSLSSFPSAPVVDGVKVMDYFSGGKYSRFGEKHGAHFATIGIIAHELGHAIFDLPDLYDTDGSSEGIGNFGLMGGGSWGYELGEDQGATPVHMCAWSKLEQGWVTPEVLTVTTNNVTMHATHTPDFNIVKLPTGNPSEYFLLENRSPSGYDAGMYTLDYIAFAGGLAIWHIDETQRAADNSDNNDETRKLVDIEEANNPELDANIGRGTRTNLYYSGNSTLFDDTSVPDTKEYDGTSTNISVNNISVVGSAGAEYEMTTDISR